MALTLAGPSGSFNFDIADNLTTLTVEQGLALPPFPGSLSSYSTNTTLYLQTTPMSTAEVTLVIVANGGALFESAYFLLNTPNTNYYVWYTIAGVGTDPSDPMNSLAIRNEVAGRTGIVVDVPHGAMNDIIADNTRLAINASAPSDLHVTSVAPNRIHITNLVGGAVSPTTDGTQRPTFFISSEVVQGASSSITGGDGTYTVKVGYHNLNYTL